MTEPRIIPADEAKAMREAASEGTWEQGKGGVEVFSVTPTSRSFVADTGSHIPREYSEVLAEARADATLIAAAPDLAHTVIQQAAQITRLWEEMYQLLDTVSYETNLHDDEGTFPETVQLGAYVESQLRRILTEGGMQ